MSYVELIRARKKVQKSLYQFMIYKENASRKYNGINKFISEYSKFKIFIKTIFPFTRSETNYKAETFYQKIYEEGTRENSIAKVLISFIMLQFIGLLMYSITAFKYAIFPQKAGVYIGIIIQIVICLNIFSKFSRCVIMLSIPSLITSKIRQIILLLLILWAFQNCAMNITKNFQQTAEGISCIQNRIIIVVKEVMKSINSLLGDKMIEDVVEIIKQILNPMEIFKKNIGDLSDIISKMTNFFSNESHILKKAQDLCDESLVGPENKCRNFVNESINYCEKKYWKIFCYPIKVLYGSCSFISVIVSHCNMPTKVIQYVNSGVNNMIISATNKTINSLKNNGKLKIFGEITDNTIKSLSSGHLIKDFGIEFAANYNSHHKNDVDLIKLQEMIKKEFEFFVKLLYYIEVFLNSAIYFVVFEGIFWSVIYLYKFLTREKHDNHYIGQRFIEMDIQREIQGMSCILPLLYREKIIYIKSFQKKLTKSERRWTYFRLILTIFSGIIPFFLVLMDIIIYNSFEMIFHFLTDDTFFEFPSLYKFKVSGNGMFAELLNKILDIFEPVSNITKKKDNMWTQCLVEPSPPNYDLFEKMFYLYLFCFFLCPAECYLKRFRHVIASSYYQSRIQPRLLYLYNEILEKRRCSIQQAIMVTKQMDDQIKLIKDHRGKGKKKNLLNKALPSLTKDLYCCTKCSRKDLKISDEFNTRICVNCHSVYCIDCYTIRKRCIDCNYTLQVMTHQIEFYHDSSGDDSEDDTSSSISSSS
ncbi:Dendritic cell-specific transmembrane protein-like domain-containing protein [Strongyloides ratti]|uniref:Dendritic cell-specific transmembrane protein-like domain-containing protein n=1 Tax=Strongyloides ratti TaxID=34506 RepID=A0A090MTV4_STRRB|nr:Dendritic cell-specific transmembrane protein-like domain-containing protein [Strongyloides ratti]CEF61788.1 Dendritic cell-specific transmembrane protein-like domain-containing protein [Strongyloides ratti]